MYAGLRSTERDKQDDLSASLIFLSAGEVALDDCKQGWTESMHVYGNRGAFFSPSSFFGT